MPDLSPFSDPSKDPLDGLTLDDLDDPNIDSVRLLRHLLARLPSDLKSELSSTLLYTAWHHITENQLRDRLLTYRPGAAADTSNTSFGHASTSTAARDFSSNWRSKSTVDQDASGNSPPPLPKFNWNRRKDQAKVQPWESDNNQQTLHSPVGKKTTAVTSTLDPPADFHEHKSTFACHQDSSSTNFIHQPMNELQNQLNASCEKALTDDHFAPATSHESQNFVTPIHAEPADDSIPMVFGSPLKEHQMTSSECLSVTSKTIDLLCDQADLSQPKDADTPAGAMQTRSEKKKLRPTKAGTFIIPELLDADVPLEFEEDFAPVDHRRQNCSEEKVQESQIHNSQPQMPSVTNTPPSGRRQSARMPKYNRDRIVAQDGCDDTFDWSSNTEGAKDSFSNLYVNKLVSGKLPPVPSQEEEEIMREMNAQNQPIQFSEEREITYTEIHAQLTMSQVAKIKFAQPSKFIGNSNVTCNKTPNEKKEPPMAMSNTGDMGFLEVHQLMCVLCTTHDHSTVDCPEPPPTKLALIRDRSLCKKCLDPGHNVTQCKVKNLRCTECHLEHLDYIYHKPTNWMSNASKRAPSTAMSTQEKVTISQFVSSSLPAPDAIAKPKSQSSFQMCSEDDNESNRPTKSPIDSSIPNASVTNELLDLLGDEFGTSPVQVNSSANRAPNDLLMDFDDWSPTDGEGNPTSFTHLQEMLNTDTSKLNVSGKSPKKSSNSKSSSSLGL